MPESIADRIARLDTSLLDAIDAQLGADDRRSLLALHSASSAALGTFAYLEIGSHLGGSLQSFVSDPACTAIVSIDPRPASQPDQRGIVYRYADNSTERMIANLARLPGAQLEKLTTIDAGTVDLRPGDLLVRPQLCFVDGEHTDEAALRDARFCREVLGGEGCIAFHDAPVVYRALSAFTVELARDGAPFDAYLLPACVFVVELGGSSLRSFQPLASQAREGYRAYLDALAGTEPYRDEYRRTINRVLRRLRRAVRRR